MGLATNFILFALVALAAAKKPASPDVVVPESLLQELSDDIGNLEVSALEAAIKKHGEHSMSPQAIARILAGARQQETMLGTNTPMDGHDMTHGESVRRDIAANAGDVGPIWSVCDCGIVCFNFVMGGSTVCDTIGMALDDTLKAENDTRHAEPCVYASDHLNETADPKCWDYSHQAGIEASVMTPLVNNTAEDQEMDPHLRLTGSEPGDESGGDTDPDTGGSIDEESEALRHALDDAVEDGGDDDGGSTTAEGGDDDGGSTTA